MAESAQSHLNPPPILPESEADRRIRLLTELQTALPDPERPPPATSLPRGTRIELTEAPGYYHRFGLTARLRGTVDFTDGLGTVHVHWDNGARVGITADSLDLIRETGE